MYLGVKNINHMAVRAACVKEKNRHWHILPDLGVEKTLQSE
jgi:hypothetical protein